MFADTEIGKRKFHCHKNQILIDDVDINKTIISNKVLCCKRFFKYFIGYKDNEKVKPLCIVLPKLIGYRKNFSKTKYMSFLKKAEEFL